MLRDVQGTTALNLDAKGRLAIPAKYRDALEDGKVVITAHPHGCLLIYSAPDWEPLRDQIRRMPSLDPGSASWKRLFVGYAQDETLDNAGRVLIAPSQRQYAGLEKQVWLVGQLTYFELWSDAGWQRQLQTMSGAVPPGFENLVL
ncbi:MAG: division/cell wall cluster transcriptional repressor MraZ [Azoarcus sp.]|jgi:MraZ protein|nr:division/cell wall cluster transcriptional repressor MraZ [Azoarcus sp.]MDR1228110.1 division/cell wall cluster transcriptional repressor MraZ [Azoarcus sp.]